MPGDGSPALSAVWDNTEDVFLKYVLQRFQAADGVIDKVKYQYTIDGAVSSFFLRIISSYLCADNSCMVPKCVYQCSSAPNRGAVRYSSIW